MRRAVLLLMLFLLVGQAAGLDRVLGEDACAQECDDDADGGKCPPVCPTCTCALRPPLILPAGAPVVVPLPAAALVVFAEADRTPTVPEPREILHVPIAVLA